ncbi:MAG: DMT family transporter [Planctomycetota bacterium]
MAEPLRHSNLSSRMTAGGRSPRGAYYMISSALCFSLMALLVKELKPSFDFFELVFARSLFGLVFTLVLIIKNRVSILGNDRKSLLRRGLFGFLGLVTYFFAIQHLDSLGDAVMLTYTNPIFVALLAPFMLKEKARPVRFLIILLSFAGMLMIVKPDFELNSVFSLIGLSSGIFTALAYIYIRKATASDSSLTIMLYLPLVSVAVTGPYVLVKSGVSAVLGSFAWITWEELLLLLAVGLLSTVAQLFLTVGFKYETASRATIYNYTAPVFAMALDLVIYLNRPDIWSFVGSAIIILSAIVIANLRERKRTGS